MKRHTLVCALLVAFAASAVHAAEPKKKITVDLLVHPEAVVSPGVRDVWWRPAHAEVSYLRTKGSGKEAVSTLYGYDVESRKETVLLGAEHNTWKLALGSYQWSPRGDALLFTGQNDLWLYDVASGQARRLTDDPDAEEDATFSPAGDRIAFVKGNNIFTVDLKGGLLKKLTTDGSENVLNGKLDWVYQEEIVNRATGRAYDWSPDGKTIVYLRLDDTPVPQYPITEYLSTHLNLLRERFPQAGDPNPEASIHAVAVEEGRAQHWTIPLSKAQAEYIYPLFSWTQESRSVSFVVLNRAQTEETAHLWTPATGEDRPLVSEKDATWISSLDPPEFLADGQRLLWVSERDGWMHIYLYGLDGQLQKQLTRGNWMVDRPVFGDLPMFQVDEKGGWIYFLSTEHGARERQIDRVRLDGTGFEQVSKEAGSHTFRLSPDGRFLVDSYSNYETPPETRLAETDGTLLTTLDKPANHLNEYALGKTEFLEVKAPDGATLYARLVKPAGFDPKKKYPAIVQVYNGPHVQLVTDQWGVTGLSDQLYAEEGFVLWKLDGRGSWGRGHAWESAIFKNLGQHELQDQLAGVAYLKSLPYVDPQRIGITGWSYGGYMTLYALTHAPGVFKCGIAGAPVTHWKFYDSIYTERYMRTPQENPEGYKAASPLEAADKLSGRLLLIHGTDDDNVHMQNSINFIEALIRAGIAFDLHIQPGERHGFGDEAARLYLYRRMLEFFKQNL